jgi:hypothetical protein
MTLHAAQLGFHRDAAKSRAVIPIFSKEIAVRWLALVLGHMRCHRQPASQPGRNPGKEGCRHARKRGNEFGLRAAMDADGRLRTSVAELLRRGYSDEDVLKIAGRNHLRAMRRMEQVAADLRRTESADQRASEKKPDPSLE